MALYSSGIKIADVALTDTFNTWRTRFNSAITDAASTSANTVFNGTVNLFNTSIESAGLTTTKRIVASGPITAPVVTANNLGGTLTTAAQGNITSVGTLTSLSTGQITGSSGAGFAHTVTAPVFAANTLTGTISTAAQGSITSVGTLTSLSTGQITGSSGAAFAHTVTAPKFSANTIIGNALDINGNGDISGNLVLGGNLTVSGTTTTVNSTNVNIGDNIIVLNSDETGTPSQDAGIEIERGTSSNKQFFWDESEDYWSVGSETFNAGALQSTTGSIGTLTITDNIKFNNFMREELQVIADNPAATQTFDVKSSTIQYYTTNTDTNFTLNVRGDGSTSLNSIMSTGESLSLTLLVTNAGTAYYANAFQIDGSSVTPKYVNGNAFSAGNVNAIDVYSFSILKTGDATFTVLASLSEYS